MTPPTEYEIARDAAKAAREAAREAVDPEARFFLKRHADLLERMAAARRRRPRRSARRGTLATGLR
ncbi:MAG TPA: hypothetical protein VGI54_09075 [Solirubrobacteraceae bacterium]|jgi:hypothetical protein